MGDVTTLQPEAAEIFRRLEALGLKQRELAGAIGIEENKVSKVKAGERQFKAGEVLKAGNWLAQVEAAGGYRATSDLPDIDPAQDYLPVSVMPSFAGMGGGGTGEGDPATGLVQRHLIEREFRGRADDFRLINVRGDSMSPIFLHGDQLLIDTRDRNPVQPGPFALFDGDAYVVKLVERIPGRRGWYRIFSANDRYSAAEVEETESTIMGRPVWFARRL